MDAVETDGRSETDLEAVNKALAILGEHFDTAQIFVTRHDSGVGSDGTRNIAMGTGNWFARFGQTAEWVTQARASMAKEATRDDD